MVPAMFAKSACCVDPFIYALNHPKIRQQIFARLYRRFFTAVAIRRAADDQDLSRQPRTLSVIREQRRQHSRRSVLKQLAENGRPNGPVAVVVVNDEHAGGMTTERWTC